MNFTKISKLYILKNNSIKEWAEKKIVGLFIFNLIIMMLVLLRSAGYFYPFFPITVNFIVFVALILTFILLGFKSREIFVIALFLWLFSGLLRLINIHVWAERSAVYVFEALIVGLSILIIERKEKNV